MWMHLYNRKALQKLRLYHVSSYDVSLVRSLYLATDREGKIWRDCANFFSLSEKLSLIVELN